jgi:hypothetical protein
VLFETRFRSKSLSLRYVAAMPQKPTFPGTRPDEEASVGPVSVCPLELNSKTP